jgi:DNA-binding response OmpR family regulator
MPKILAADDDEYIRLLFSLELNEAGYEVVTADCGYKLLEKIEEEKPDLVILDIKMTDYNGLDILLKIRNHFYDLPVILWTACDYFEGETKSIEVNFHVLKSFDLTELKEKIVMALEIGRPSWQPVWQDSPDLSKWL